MRNRDLLLKQARETIHNLPKLSKAAIKTIQDTQGFIQRLVRQDPAAYLAPYRSESHKGLLAIDVAAESLADDTFRRNVGLTEREQLLFLGEERLSAKANKNLDLTHELRPVVLVDMVDGTDLLARGLYNWCSAMVIIDPQAAAGNKILACFVGIPGDGVYYATRDHEEPRKYEYPNDPHRVYNRATPKGGKGVSFYDVPLSGTLSTIKDIQEASICFYGQQVSALSEVTHETRFVRKLMTISKRYGKKNLGDKLRTRIYNLAGIPMMVKMISSDGLQPIDAVFDVHGQSPHDVVAGAYITLKAGAVFSSVSKPPADGAALLNLHPFYYLEQSILHPNDSAYKLRYVIACTVELHDQLKSLLVD